MILTLLVLFPIGQVSAQNQGLTREERLRQLAHPTFVLDGNALSFQQATLQLDTISEDDGAVEVLYVCRNTTQKALSITRVQVSCDCVEAHFSSGVIQPGEQAELRAVYFPLGYPGAFSRYLTIYTSLSQQQPTARVYFKGYATASQNPATRFPFQIEQLYFKQGEVVFQQRGQRQVERVLVYNASELPMTLSATLPEGFTLNSEPAVIEAGAEGDIVVTYDGVTPSKADAVIPVTLNGIKGPQAYPFLIRFKH